ncbi:Interleukin-1 receptor accessory protein-like 1-B [Frankliniella fusca]|uniref:Interleukin-1 receptor accessory protein-like 1-B n=1 Tax=Frankliniella fusca TaxID=407009 RepID=A0AAE1HLK1_9NEOP|nr:Interleukin-1 receptor accessory protein-like 1-B [Frankliniella fusca]
MQTFLVAVSGAGHLASRSMCTISFLLGLSTLSILALQSLIRLMILSADIHMPASVQNSFLEQLQWHLCLMSWPFEFGTNSTLGNHFISVLNHSRPPEESLYGAQTCDRGFLPLLPVN